MSLSPLFSNHFNISDQLVFHRVAGIELSLDLIFLIDMNLLGCRLRQSHAQETLGVLGLDGMMIDIGGQFHLCGELAIGYFHQVIGAPLARRVGAHPAYGEQIAIDADGKVFLIHSSDFHAHDIVGIGFKHIRRRSPEPWPHRNSPVDQVGVEEVSSGR